MSLSLWCYLLGVLFSVLGLSIMVLPEKMSRLFNALPRHQIASYVLAAIAWLWVGYALWTMDLDIINPFKNYLFIAVPVCIGLSCWWMENLLSCRAIGAILTLFPYELIHAARVHPSPWRLVLVTFAYLCIVKGMVLILYPWYMRQSIVFVTARPWLFKTMAALNIAFGALLIGLGATVLG
jgi:hypothetical protein